MSFKLTSRRLSRVALVCLGFSVLLVPELTGQDRQDRRARRTVILDGREAVEGEVLVRFRTPPGGFEEARAANDVEADESESISRSGIRRWRARRLSTRALLTRLRANPDVEFVEPNYILSVGSVPNDPSFGNLWGLFNSGQLISGAWGTAGADIDVPLAWDLSTGSRDNVVGVIDTGIDYGHPDLAANIWSAPSAFSVTIGGVVITCPAGSHGFNAINHSCDPMDDHSHGTHVAGTIGAVGNNGVGITGVAWTASMMGLKFLGANGSGFTSNAIKAIDFAIQAKAVFAGTSAANVRVLSNSWGGGGFSQSLLDAINRANAANMLFVAAAGNSALNNDSYPHYPSSYTAANVLAIASTTNRDQRSSFSNYGAVSVDLGAPGSSILSTVPNNGYAYYNGTSMATPHVAGAAALLLSACALDTAALKSAIMIATDPIPAMSGLSVTGGRLNVNNAIRVCPPLLTPVPVVAALSPSISYAGQPFVLTVEGSGFLSTSQIRIDGSSRSTNYVSSTRLTTEFASGELPSVGARAVSVFSPGPGGGTSGSLNLTVQAPPTLTVNGTTGAVTVAPNALLATAIAGGPAHRFDWVTLAPVGSGPTTYTGIWFLSGTATPPASGLPNATLLIPAPSAEGTYEVRFLANGRYQRLATSGAIMVIASRPVPQLTALSPAGAVEGTSRLDVVVNGSNFHTSSRVLLNGAPRPTTFGSANTLTVSLASADLAAIATHSIAVNTPAPGGGTSTAATFRVIAIPPNPRLTSISPTSVGVTASPLTLTVTGTGFAHHSKVVVGVTSIPTTYVSSTSLTAAVPANELATPGNKTVFVLTPAPGGGASDIATLTVVGPVMTVNGSSGPISVAPGASMTIAVANGPAGPTDWVTLAPIGSSPTTYTGIWFLNGSAAPPAAGTSSATFTIPAPATEGSFEARFLANGRYQRLATSGVITVERVNPAPQLSALVPASVAAGTNGVSVTVTGSGFTASSHVRFNGAARATTFNNASALTVALPAGDLTGVATHSITVVTPAPGGGTSAGAAFTVTTPPAAPTVSLLTPASIGIRSIPLTLTVTGTGFAGNSQLHLDGVARPTVVTSSTSLSAVIPSGDLATAGPRSVTVVTPAPGGGTSAAAALMVVGPVVTVNGSSGAVTVEPGVAITISVANGPANPADWVTFAPTGSTSTTYQGIWFLSGTGMPPPSGVASASFTVPAPIVEGSYEVRFLANGRYQRLATSAVVTVERSNPVPQVSAVAPTAVPAGSTGISVTVTGSGFAASSQVRFDGLVRSTTFNNAGSLTAALSASDLVSAGAHTLTVFTPAPSGGTSTGVTFTVTPPPTLTVNGTTGGLTVAPGELITVVVANGPANQTDWVTIAPVGSVPTAYAGIWFLNGTSVPPSSGASSATLMIPAPAVEGSYEVRYLANGRYQRLATSGTITVAAAGRE